MHLTQASPCVSIQMKFRMQITEHSDNFAVVETWQQQETKSKHAQMTWKRNAERMKFSLKGAKKPEKAI